MKRAFKHVKLYYPSSAIVLCFKTNPFGIVCKTLPIVLSRHHLVQLYQKSTEITDRAKNTIAQLFLHCNLHNNIDNHFYRCYTYQYQCSPCIHTLPFDSCLYPDSVYIPIIFQTIHNQCSVHVQCQTALS